MDLNILPMLILVEPTLMTRQVLAEFTQSGANSPFAPLERDMWPSREDARAWMSRRSPWKDWKSQVLDHFIEFALRDLPIATYPNTRSGVTLCCTRQQEAISDQDAFDSIDRLTELCGMLPVHCIFGAKHDLVAAETQQALISGRRMASVTRIPGAGHLVVQEQPFKLAERVFAILNPDDYSVCKL